MVVYVHYAISERSTHVNGQLTRIRGIDDGFAADVADGVDACVVVSVVYVVVVDVVLR